MYFFSGYVNMSLDDAVAATTQVLQRHRLTVLAQFDPGKTLKPRLAANCRPCIILSAYSPELTRRAMQADEETGSIVFCNVLIQEQTDGRVKMQQVGHPAIGPHDTPPYCSRWSSRRNR